MGGGETGGEGGAGSEQGRAAGKERHGRACARSQHTHQSTGPGRPPPAAPSASPLSLIYTSSIHHLYIIYTSSIPSDRGRVPRAAADPRVAHQVRLRAQRGQGETMGADGGGGEETAMGRGGGEGRGRFVLFEQGECCLNRGRRSPALHASLTTRHGTLPYSLFFNLCRRTRCARRCARCAAADDAFFVAASCSARRWRAFLPAVRRPHVPLSPLYIFHPHPQVFRFLPLLHLPLVKPPPFSSCYRMHTYATRPL